MAQPITTKVALALNGIAFLAMGVTGIVDHKSEFVHPMAHGEPHATRYCSLALIGFAFSCFAGIAAGLTGGRAATGAPPLIGAAAFNLGAALFFFGLHDKHACGTHAFLGGVSILGFVHAHYVRWGGLAVKRKKIR